MKHETSVNPAVQRPIVILIIILFQFSCLKYVIIVFYSHQYTIFTPLQSVGTYGMYWCIFPNEKITIHIEGGGGGETYFYELLMAL